MKKINLMMVLFTLTIVFAFGTDIVGNKVDGNLEVTGNVGIGTITPEYPLDVVGIIRAHEIIVNTDKTADYVFKDDYKLKTIDEVDTYISKNGHLPDVPSEADVKVNGISLGDMNRILLQKIEELTLYAIELNKRINELEK